MGVRFNNNGFVLMQPDGELVWDSAVSAHSRKPVAPGGVLEAVPDAPGLFVRLLPREARQLPDADRVAAHERARAWRAGLTEAAGGSAIRQPFPDDGDLPAGHIRVDRGEGLEVIDLAAQTVEHLQALAKVIDLPGRSKLNRDDLIAALADAIADEVIDLTAEDDGDDAA